jgi:CRP-like cAMP-binding protein
MSFNASAKPRPIKACGDCGARKKNVFCDLPEAGVQLLDQSKVVNHYKRGQTIFYSGNFPAGLYCVNGGVVKLEAPSESGNGHILRVAQEGDMLGYRSLFADESYQASAVVQEDATVCMIPKQAVMELVEKHPNIAIQFLTRISKELRQAEDRFRGAVDKAAPERIAEAVLFLKENFADQSWTRKDIAEWAGTTPETVMRTLADFEEEGLIAQIGRKIEVRNKRALLDRANLKF